MSNTKKYLTLGVILVILLTILFAWTRITNPTGEITKTFTFQKIKLTKSAAGKVITAGGKIEE